MSKYKIIEEKLKYSGKISKFYSQKILLPNKKKIDIDILKQQDAVAILAITEEKKILLVKQHRFGANKEMVEIPAGYVDENESYQSAVKRELLEETGYEAKKIKKIFAVYTSPGIATSKLILFFSENVKKISKQNLDEDEFVEILELSFKEFFENNFEDSKTLLAREFLKNIVK